MDTIQTDIVVIGAGPGGYTAAFYAADKGKKVILVEREDRLGGVCMNRGCIPSKSFLHVAHQIKEARECGNRGVHFGEPKIDLAQLRAWKDSVLTKLGQGIQGLAKRRNVEVMHGRGYFEDSKTLRVETSQGQKYITFDKAIIAVGSKPAMPKAFDLGNPRVMTSTEALELPDIPKDLLIIGGGYIGLELGTVYSTLGSQVVIVEANPNILMGADNDLVGPILRYAEKNFKEMRVQTKVKGMATVGKQIKVTFEMKGETKDELFDRVLISVGRTPGGQDLGLENTRVERDEKGFIKVNHKQQTAEPNIYAVGDIAGGALLAHKASKEARVAVEVIAGESSEFTTDIIVPAVVFTDPELAWCGLTENEAHQKGIPFEVAKFPWSASGRALSYDRPDGMTKILVQPETERVLGMAICGHGAGELIAECVVAIEMGATVRDLAECIHPHPTLSETIMECAESYYGVATHSISRKKADH